MRLRKAALLSTCVWLAGSGMALAQSVDSGNEVTVNPIAGGSGVLLYPGDQYMRVIHPALQPGETARDMGTIQLHMPTRHRVAARKAPAAPSSRDRCPPEVAAAAPPNRKQAKAKPQPKAVAAAAAQAQPAPNSGFGDLGAQGAVGLSLGLAPPPAQPAPHPHWPGQSRRPPMSPRRPARGRKRRACPSAASSCSRPRPPIPPSPRWARSSSWRAISMPP